MRAAFLRALGALEAALAVVLSLLAWQLPGPAEVRDGVGRAERISRHSAGQVLRLRGQVAALRERQPQVHELAVRLQGQLREATDQLRGQHVDFAAVRSAGDALGDIARGLDGMGDALDPKAITQAGAGLGAAADFLDGQLAPAAAAAADRLDASTDALRADARRLSGLLRQAPLDLKAVREIHASLGRFSDGLGRADAAFKPERLEAMREGFKGMQDALTAGAEQVERLAGYTYPAVALNGLRPAVEQRPFWPEGETVAAGMRKAAKGSSAAAEELQALASDLPRLRASLDESRKVAERTRDALGEALKQQEKVEALLKDVPGHAARLVDELPQLGADLSRILRDTSRLKEMAAVLRQAQKGADAAAAHWPDARRAFGRSAELLRAAQTQLRSAVEHRQEYERSLEQTVVLARAFAAALPLLSDQLEGELREEEQALADLGGSLDEASAALPAYGESAARILQTTRLLLALGAVAFALHGGYLLLGGLLGPRPAA
jgi:DNA repair ATPase RecN